MRDLPAPNEDALCRWFSTIFAREQSPEAVQAYLAGAAEPFLSVLELQGVAPAMISGFRTAISRVGMCPDSPRALALAYTALFITPGREAAPPYASLYQDKGLLFGPAHQRMQQRLARSGLAVVETAREPADHIAVMLEYLAHCTDDSRASRAIIGNDLLPWLSRFADRIAEHEQAPGFYTAAARLLIAALTHRHEMLAG